jgi:hypothetical protein
MTGETPDTNPSNDTPRVGRSLAQQEAAADFEEAMELKMYGGLLGDTELAAEANQKAAAANIAMGAAYRAAHPEAQEHGQPTDEAGQSPHHEDPR